MTQLVQAQPMGVTVPDYMLAMAGKNKHITEALGSFGGDFNSISFARRQFNLNFGGTSETLKDVTGHPASVLNFVLLNLAVDRHCTWYDKPYDTRAGAKNDSPPAAVWWTKGPVPSNVPEYVLTTKKVENGRESRWYQISQRLVVLIYEAGSRGLALNTEDIFAMDIAGMSIFGASSPPAYSFKDLARTLLNFPAPFAFPLSATFTQDNVPVLRFGLPTNQQGAPYFFDQVTYTKLQELAESPEVAGLLDPVGNRAVAPAQNQTQAQPAPVASPPPVYTPPPAPAQASVPVYTAPPPPSPPAPAMANMPDVSTLETAKRRGRQRLQQTAPPPPPTPAFTPPPAPAPAPAPGPVSGELLTEDQVLAIMNGASGGN